MLDAAGAQGADLALLPEGFMAAGLPATSIPDVAEPLDGPSFKAVAEKAQRHSMYVVAGFYAKVDGHISNLSALIDRSGRLVGTYSKRHPTEGEIDNGVMPGGTVRRLRHRFRPRRPCDLLRPELAGPLGEDGGEGRRGRLLDFRL